MINEFLYRDKTIETSAEPVSDGAEVSINGTAYRVQNIGDGKYTVELDGVKKTACCVIRKDRAYLDVEGILLELTIPSEDGGIAGGAAAGAGEKDKVFAPMPGKVVKLLVKEGDEVSQKQPLVIVEAMKMENQVNSPADGKVKKINFSDGDQVDTDTPIIELDIES